MILLRIFLCLLTSACIAWIGYWCGRKKGYDRGSHYGRNIAHLQWQEYYEQQRGNWEATRHRLMQQIAPFERAKGKNGKFTGRK